MSFGSAFVNAYAATSQVQENKKRGLILESAEKRAQEEFDTKKADKVKIEGYIQEMADMAVDHQQSMLDRARASQAASDQAVAGPAAQGLQVPPSQANAAPVTPPPQPAPPPAAPAGAAPPSPGAADQASVNQAASPEPAPAAPRTAALAPPPGIGGPSPGAAPVGAPPSLSVKDHIQAASDYVAKLTKVQIKLLGLTHPLEAAKLASAVSDPVMQEKMRMMAAFASMANVNSADPNLNKMLTLVHPNAVAGSWRPMQPDKDGNQYAQFTERLPDGTTREVAVNPRSINAMLISTLSPDKIVDESRQVEEQKRKEAETKAQIEDHEKTREHYADVLKQQIQEHKDLLPIRQAQANAALMGASAHKATAEGALEERKASRLSREESEAMKAGMELTGYAKMAETDQEGAISKLSELMAGVQGLGGANNINIGNRSAFTRLAGVMTKIKNMQGIGEKDGKFYVDPGDGKLLVVPPHLLPGKPNVTPKAQPQAQPPQRGLGQP